jgi:ADP-heptose:LPS heptosyltransferase
LHFVALQPRDGLDQLRASPLAGRLEVVGDRLSDLTEMAAALAAVDLVVGTGGPTTHLAGALGRPTYVMLPANANWRWLVGRDDSPWYPTLRLFRQPRAGDWDSVVAALGGALARLTGGP